MVRQSSALPIAFLSLFLLAFASPRTSSSAVTQLDPGLKGAFAVATDEYDFGDQAFTAIGSSHPVELRAVVHHPADLTAGPYPLVLLMHGADIPCHVKKRGLIAWPCPSGSKPVPSYRGYDYLAEVLASNGFIVVSVSVDGINAQQDVADEREQLMQKHLDVWKMFSTTGGAPFGDAFVGKVDMNRIGTMGHSAAGQAIVDHYAFNLRQSAPYSIKAVLALAPVDSLRHSINGVPLAVMTGYCDGQVGLSGLHYFDDSLFNAPGDPAPKHHILIMGANHVFFNTVWTPGLFEPNPGDDGKFCDGDSRTGRITAEEQQAVATVYISAFYRAYLRGEAQFLPLLTGAAAAPSSISFSKVFVSYQPPDDPAFRLDVNRMQDPGTLMTNTLGGAVRGIGLSPFDACGGSGEPDHCLAPFNPIMEPDSGLGQLRLAWSDQTAFYENDLPPGSRDVSRYEALQFRVGVNFQDNTNKKHKPQDFSVELADGGGKTASVVVSSVSGALYFPPGVNSSVGVAPRLALNQVRIPLSAFSGISLQDVRSIVFKFDRTRRGSLLLSDLTFVSTADPTRVSPSKSP
jgi:hypothetical protein